MVFQYGLFSLVYVYLFRIAARGEAELICWKIADSHALLKCA